ncbi:hypothetical protein SEA_EVAA_81 [Gordonia phage Evaa]|nr:hypothetical protein SEA_EVAA_81 [Gordonia phage Evaa]
MSTATKFRTETAAIAASNGWAVDTEHDDTARIDTFERAGVTATIAYTDSDRVSYAHLFQGSTLIDEIAKGTANKLAGVREWLMAEAPEVEEEPVVEDKVAVETYAQLDEMTKRELMELAVAYDIRGRRSMNKDGLIQALMAAKL